MRAGKTRIDILPIDANFPSFSEGLSLRVRFAEHALTSQRRFPFLFGGAFIEASTEWAWRWKQKYFPSFWEGLSLRGACLQPPRGCVSDFPSFWEGLSLRLCDSGGISEVSIWDFHSLLEGLSLRCLGVVINPSAQMLILNCAPKLGRYK